MFFKWCLYIEYSVFVWIIFGEKWQPEFSRVGLEEVNKVNILLYVAAILYYGVTASGLGIGIYATIYFAKLLDVTIKQFFIALSGGLLLSAFNLAFHYFSSTHMVSSLYNNIFIDIVLTLGSIIIVCLIYFIIAGRGNLLKTYHVNISGKWPREIKELKELNRWTSPLTTTTKICSTIERCFLPLKKVPPIILTMWRK